MRVAIVGANLLGSACAFYIRRALNANRVESSANAGESCPKISEESKLNQKGNNTAGREDDEIFVFERMSRGGGNKFLTLKVDDVEAVAGTASEADVAKSPALCTLLKDSGLAMPERTLSREWVVYDWAADEYKIGQMRSRSIAKLREMWLVCMVLQLCLIASAVFFALRLRKCGFDLFIMLNNGGDYVPRVQYIVWFSLLLLLGLGLLPVRLVLRAYGALYFYAVAQITAGMTYGGHSVATLRNLMSQIQDHLQIVVDQDSASSCITLGHLLSACGLGKYARASILETVEKVQLQQSVLDDCVTPNLVHTYSNSKVAAEQTTNSLAALLNMLNTCRLPASFRRSARYFGTEETKNICPQLLEVAKAEVRYGTEIRSVKDIGMNRYEIFGSSKDGDEVSLGTFDAVVLAAAVDPDNFVADAAESPLDELLSLRPEINGQHGVQKLTMNTARFISLIKGEINPEFFTRSCASSVGDQVFVQNSVNCSQIVRVADRTYRVSSHEKPEEGSALFTTVFNDVSRFVTWEIPGRRYYPSPLRDLHGNESPAFIIGTRFLYAACVDRIANDSNLDCLSARNCASFFRNGVATWK